MKALGGFLAGIVLASMITFGLTARYYAVHPMYLTQYDTLIVNVDSIRKIIDTVEVQKTLILHEYEDAKETIRNQSASDDYDFFVNYLRTRFPSDYNNYPAQTGEFGLR